MTIETMLLHSRAVWYIAALTLHTLSAASSSAAQLPTISGGTRVRIEAQPTGEKITGTLFSQTADSIAIASGGLIRVLPTESIARMQVSSGRSHTHGAYRGIQMGTLIGGGTGAVIFGTTYASYPGPKQPAELLAFVAASALSGAFYGAIIGGAVGSESWTPVYNNRVSVAVRGPSRGATGIGLSLKL